MTMNSIKPSVSPFQASTGDSFQVSVLTTGQICDLLPILKRIKNSLPDGGNVDLLDMIAENIDDVVQAVAVAANASVEQIRALPIDDTIALAALFYSQNKDFFLQRVLPAIAGKLPALTKPAK